VSAGISEWRPPSPLDPAGALFYASLLIGIAVILMRVRSDGNRVRLAIAAPVTTLLGFGLLGIVTGRGLAWWALVLPVAGAAMAHDANLTRLLPRFLAPIGTLLSGPRPVRADGSPIPATAATAARTARAQRGSPLNFAVGVVLTLAAVALLPLWRPLGPAGVPIGTLTFAPQRLVAELRTAHGVARPSTALHVWAPQTWGSWLELALPEMQVAADSRVELYPASFWKDVATVAAGAQGTLDILSRYDVDVVVIPVEQRNGPLFQALIASSAWGRVYYETDVDAELFIRVAPQP
jgi:hypothetical protein